MLNTTVGSLQVSLVDAALRGDREAFGALVEPELPIALGAAQILTDSAADAADAV